MVRMLYRRLVSACRVSWVAVVVKLGLDRCVPIFQLLHIGYTVSSTVESTATAGAGSATTTLASKKRGKVTSEPYIAHHRLVAVVSDIAVSVCVCVCGGVFAAVPEAVNAQLLMNSSPDALFATGIPAHVVFPADSKVLWLRVLSVVTNIEILSRIDRSA